MWGAFTAVATDGRQVGVHVVVAGDRAASVPTSLGSTIQKRLVLRLASEDDYLTLGVPKDVLSLTSPPGRGVLDENEVQVAVLGGDPNVALQARELGKLRDAMTRLGIPQAPGVERLPDGFALESLPEVTGGRPTIGLDDLDIAPVGLPARGTFMLSGPPGGGRTTALVTIAQAVRRARAGRVVYLSPRRTSISALDAWDTVATSPEEVVTLLETLTQAIESGSLRPGTLTVLIESVTELTGTPAEQPLVAFVRAATRPSSSSWARRSPRRGARRGRSRSRSRQGAPVCS